jgi:peptidoglycan hydrolase-like protein with peptidoglycan-binding domain
MPPLLKKGAKGETVKRLQRALSSAGHAIAVDGDFGPATARAVKAFQADCIVGLATWGALSGGGGGCGGGGHGRRLS